VVAYKNVKDFKLGMERIGLVPKRLTTLKGI
jgi:hypothetical protein